MLVAVYGTLKQGNSNHSLMMDSTLVSKETLKGFIMYNVGGFPVIYRDTDHSIVVEIFEVSEKILSLHLDPLEGHPRWYRREQVATSVGTAWLYIMTDERYRVQNRLIISGEF
jgi:gamma-glutamylaminecyclotransferase